MTDDRPPKWSAWAIALALALCTLVLPRRAFASNDDEVNTLIESVFESEYANKEYVDALEKLQLANDVCQKGSCSAKVRGKLLVAVGTVLAGGLDQGNDAQEVFKQATKEDPGATLLKGHDTGKIKDAWDASRGKAKPPTHVEPPAPTRKKYPGGGRLVAGWHSPEAYWYADQAKQAEEARSWADCAGYASDSLAVEDRVSTKYLRAECNERGGKWVEAVTDYQAVADTGAKAGMKDTAKTAGDKVTELTGKVPKLVLHPPAKTDGLKVLVDDTEVKTETLGGEIWENPGPHHISATGKQDGADVAFEQDVSLEPLKTETVEIALAAKEEHVADAAIMTCITKAKSKAEMQNCVGGATEKTPINVTFGTDVSGYIDTDHTEVLTPSVNFTVEGPTSGWSVNGSFLVDVVTTASTDIVATASPRWTEIRYAPGLGGSKKFGDVTLGLHASASFEPDYISGAGGATFAVDLKQKTITPLVDYDFSYDLAGRSGTPWSVFSHQILTNAIGLGISLVLDRSTVLTLMSNTVIETGDTSKPYRYVPMFKPKDAMIVPAGLTVDAVNEFREPEKVLEQVPTNRERFALSARLAHRFTAVTFRGEERLYTDTWGLKASTTDLTLPIDFGDHVRIWPHARAHLQTGVNFWQIAYAATVATSPSGATTVTVPQYRTGNRELGPLIGITGGLGARFTFTDAFAITMAGDAVFTRFLDDLFILQRTAFVGSVGAEFAFE